ncbi:hypothetical protein [Nocardia pseudovaccinii]|uniref:hypothetical protein n=1 Tax=Nocardia pseudovaccinii TaxID=189540 RepID=UPI0007A52611|nr:hypothetical protein [Nocardia pseudovaccinii]
MSSTAEHGCGVECGAAARTHTATDIALLGRTTRARIPRESADERPDEIDNGNPSDSIDVTVTLRQVDLTARFPNSAAVVVLSRKSETTQRIPRAPDRGS